MHHEQRKRRNERTKAGRARQDTCKVPTLPTPPTYRHHQTPHHPTPNSPLTARSNQQPHGKQETQQLKLQGSEIERVLLWSSDTSQTVKDGVFLHLAVCKSWARVTRNGSC